MRQHIVIANSIVVGFVLAGLIIGSSIIASVYINDSIKARQAEYIVNTNISALQNEVLGGNPYIAAAANAWEIRMSKDD